MTNSSRRPFPTASLPVAVEMCQPWGQRIQLKRRPMCERPVVHIHDPLLILEALPGFVCLEQTCRGPGLVGRCVRVKHFDIEVCILPLVQKPVARTSARALADVIVLRAEKTSPDRGKRTGSTATLWQTSVKSSAVMSRSSLCLIMGNPPKEHTIAWSAENGFPQTHETGTESKCQL